MRKLIFILTLLAVMSLSGFNSATESDTVFHDYKLGDNIADEQFRGRLYKTIYNCHYKEYEIYFEIEVETPGVSYTNPCIRCNYFKAVMLDSLFDKLIKKRVEYEAEKLLQPSWYPESYEIKSISIVNRNEKKKLVYGGEE